MTKKKINLLTLFFHRRTRQSSCSSEPVSPSEPTDTVCCVATPTTPVTCTSTTTFSHEHTSATPHVTRRQANRSNSKEKVRLTLIFFEKSVSENFVRSFPTYSPKSCINFEIILCVCWFWLVDYEWNI